MPPRSQVDEFDRVIKELSEYLEQAKIVRQQIVEAEARLERRVADRRKTARGGRRAIDKSTT